MSITPVLQFGTSRFLQAHADLFMSEAREQGQDCGPITVVQTTGDAGRAKRLAALALPGGFPVRVRGVLDGAVVDDEFRVTSVSRALSATSDWAQVVHIAVEEASIILSNTGDQGYAPLPADGGRVFDPAMSYPAKLLCLLEARFTADGGARALQIMPTELVARNGEVLKARVLALAHNRTPAFGDWLQGGVIWANSLVDRIVSAPIEPAGSVAEPYALWAIEAQPGLRPPCLHPAIRIVDDLELTETLKLYILNLGHTVLAADWLNRSGHGPQLVRDAMADAALRSMLIDVYEAEVLPGFAAAGFGAEARAYVETTMERFSNPFLDHKLSDIADNHAQKVQRRMGGFMAWAARHGDTGPKPALRKIAG